MSKLMKLAGAMLAVVIAGPAFAVDLTPVPVIPGLVPAAPAPEAVPLDEAPEELFECVKYVDRHEMHCCAVEKIIKVNDPCAVKCKRNCCCCEEPKCVYIKICVPPCGCEQIRCRRDGDRIRYSYGKYAVDVRVKKGYIVVDYQDWF